MQHCADIYDRTLEQSIASNAIYSDFKVLSVQFYCIGKATWIKENN